MENWKETNVNENAYSIRRGFYETVLTRIVRL